MIAKNTLFFRALLEMARQRPNPDGKRCGYVLEVLSVATAIRLRIHRDLSDLGLTEASFGVLAVLLILEPDRSTPAALALQTGVTRAAMTEIIDRLSLREYVRRVRDPIDRRSTYVCLTDLGRGTAETAIARFIEASTRVARCVDQESGATLAVVCEQLARGCT